MHEVKTTCHVKEYILEIEFEDGTKKTVDFKNRLYGKVFATFEINAYIVLI
jgi:hypothetical protein